jgi:D-cysteine desulfhydrase
VAQRGDELGDEKTTKWEVDDRLFATEWTCRQRELAYIELVGDFTLMAVLDANVLELVGIETELELGVEDTTKRLLHLWPDNRRIVVSELVANAATWCFGEALEGLNDNGVPGANELGGLLRDRFEHGVWIATRHVDGEVVDEIAVDDELDVFGASSSGTGAVIVEQLGELVVLMEVLHQVWHAVSKVVPFSQVEVAHDDLDALDRFFVHTTDFSAILRMISLSWRSRFVAASPRLFDRFPSLRGKLAWMPLADVPTPVERMNAISEWLGRDDVWMKRDDLISPLYGGNKVRRYEYVLAEAKRLERTKIVTVGGLASTQVMATALFGQAHGFKVSVIYFDQPHTQFMREALLVSANAGAKQIYGGNYLSTIYKTIREYRSEPGAYFIPPGAANPIANLGYIDAMLELGDQVARGEMPRPDLIVLPTGSSGTLAALAIGARLLGWNTKIIGVRITAKIATNAITIGSVARATWNFLRARAPELTTILPIHYELLHSALGKGYGHPTTAAIEAMPQVQKLIGASGEVTYSAKALVGLRDIAMRPAYSQSTILLWNTLSSRRPDVSTLDPLTTLPPAFHRFYQKTLPV